LKELACEALSFLIDQVSKSTFEKYLLPELKLEMSENETPEFLSLTIKMETNFSLNISQIYPKWKEGILSEKNLGKLIDILKESTYTHPRVHSVWNQVIEKFLEISKTDESRFYSFWNIVIDEGLFPSTLERKYLGFQLFEKVLPRLKASQIPFVFTKNFLRCFINHLSNPSNYLHKSATQVSQTILSVTKSNPSATVPIALQLTGEHGNQNFDRLTKSTLVQNLLGNLDLAGINDFIKYLRDIFLNQKKEQSEDWEAAVENQRIWSINQMYGLTKQQKIPKEESWLKSTLEFFMIQGFFEQPKNKKNQRKRVLRMSGIHGLPKFLSVDVSEGLVPIDSSVYWEI